MNSQNRNQDFTEHQIRFAMERVKAIRKRVKQSYEHKGQLVDLLKDKTFLRVQAVMWLAAKEQSTIEQANQWTEACATMEAECILAGVFEKDFLG